MCHKTDSQTLIALGANLDSPVGMPAETLRRALDALADAGFRIDNVSNFYQTPCFPEGAGPDYVNAVARLSAGQEPNVTLDALHRIEVAFGRTRDRRWGGRTIDMDLLASGSAVLPDLQTFKAWAELPQKAQLRTAPKELILPHPRLHERGFVLIPMADVAPDWRHPVLGKTVSEMVNDLPAAVRSAIKPL